MDSPYPNDKQWLVSHRKVPSGKRTKNYGKIHHSVLGKYPLFLWPCSIAMLVYQRVKWDELISHLKFLAKSTKITGLAKSDFPWFPSGQWCAPLGPGIALQTAMGQAGDGQPRMMSHKLLPQRWEKKLSLSRNGFIYFFNQLWYNIWPERGLYIFLNQLWYNSWPEMDSNMV